MRIGGDLEGVIARDLRWFSRRGLDVDDRSVFVDNIDDSPDFDPRDLARYRNLDRDRIQTLRQTGKGKADAVRLGFANATQPLLTILDADLTMPPEMLSRFYQAYCEGRGDFVNGSRLVYPIEGDAMRFLNRLGNVFFAKSLSWILAPAWRLSLRHEALNQPRLSPLCRVARRFRQFRSGRRF
jgi:glycosyltransferase involved in cell wall biosynthesis